jgi:biotin carboxyl carrier protein
VKRELIINGKTCQVDDVKIDGSELRFVFEGKAYVFSQRKGTTGLMMTHDHQNHVVSCSRTARNVQVNIGSLEAFVEVPGAVRTKKAGSGGSGSLKSPMPGNIYKIFAREGSRVKKGDKILILEAMKMEHTLTAGMDGRLTKLFYQEGDQVEGEVELAVITPGEETE